MSKENLCCRLKAGWRTEFCSVPSGINVKSIVHGPFREHLQLVKNSAFANVEKLKCSKLKSDLNHEIYYDIPFVLEFSEKNSENVSFKRGIPDPWIEYLILRKLTGDCQLIDAKDLIVWNENLNTLENLYYKEGVCFTQGIPDPWKAWPRMKKNDKEIEKNIKCNLKNDRKMTKDDLKDVSESTPKIIEIKPPIVEIVPEKKVSKKRLVHKKRNGEWTWDDYFQDSSKREYSKSN